MSAANDDNWQVLPPRARADLFKAIERAAIQDAMARRSKRAEFMGTVYLAFAGIMLGAIVGLFIRGL